MLFRVTSAVAGSAAALLLSSVAFAADMPAYDPIPPMPAAAPMPAYWTGFYLGFGVGGGLAHDDYDFDTLDGSAGVDHTGEGGWLVDGTLGYDHRMGAFLLGAFGDVVWSDTGSDAGITIEDLIDDGGTNVDAYLDSEWGYDVMVRAGLLLNEHALLYALGGYSWRTFDAGYDYEEYDDVAPTVASSDEDSHGWTFGAGIEAMITGSLSVKGEYRYTNFEEVALEMPDDTSVEIDPSEHTARIGLNYRFGSFF